MFESWMAWPTVEVSSAPGRLQLFLFFFIFFSSWYLRNIWFRVISFFFTVYTNACSDHERGWQNDSEWIHLNTPSPLSRSFSVLRLSPPPPSFCSYTCIMGGKQHNDLESQHPSLECHKPPLKHQLCLIPMLLWNNTLSILRVFRSNRAFKLLIALCFVYAASLTFYNMNIYEPFTKPTFKDPSIEVVNEFSPETALRLLERGGNNYQFQWEHWVNLTDSDTSKTDYRFFDFTSRPFFAPPVMPGSTYELRRVGQTFLKTYAETPAKILDLASKKTYVLKPKHWQSENKFQKIWESVQKTFLSRLTNQKFLEKMPKLHSVGEYQQKVYEVYLEIEKDKLLPSPIKKRQSEQDDWVLEELDNSSFVLNVTEHIEPSVKNEETEFHASFTKTTLSSIDKSAKSFHELWLKHDTYLGMHYDWRFFRQLRRGDDAKETLHHLVHAWSSFTQSEGVLNWIAHGALLGWFWNGFTLPWDADIDIQMPVSELDRLARKYNNTLIIQDPVDGDGRYYLEVSPSYIQRVSGNGNNLIDARFIDIRSGLFLDITGLAYNHNDNSLVGCKNHHYYHVQDIYPLRMSTYEGTRVYVPNNYQNVLSSEYAGYTQQSFHQHTYNKNMRLWVADTDGCQNFQDVNQSYTKDGELTLYGACNNNDLWQLYNTTQELTNLHNQELDFWKTMNPNGEKTLEELVTHQSELAKFAVSKRPLYPSPRYIESNSTDL